MFKFLRITVSLVFLAVFAVFMVFYVKTNLETDKTIPVITLDKDYIEVSVDANNDKLLKGVTAFDEKDGDITSQIIVESISRFIEDGVCKVTYAVCDNDNHVATATRKVIFNDYTSPRYTLNKSLCYSTYEAVDVKNALDVIDCFDGSLKDSVLITSTDYSVASAGVFSIDLAVTNSKGDEAKLTLPLIVEDRSLSAPVIELKDYLIYVNKGEKVNTKDNIISVTDSSGKDMMEDVIIDTNLDVNKEGIYIVHYFATDNKDNRGHSTLYVIVESEEG
ncbi:MAG: DUF5011 domain-containing protein [Ruminococcaceae bacterium]|nr:DUF5011 domain-containing protein [Oscillospiraceae bacterium]